MRCAMTDREYPEFTDGVWEDGVWTSWDWIHQQIYGQQLQAQYPEAASELINVFMRLMEAATDHNAITGNYLQVWGEMGVSYMPRSSSV